MVFRSKHLKSAFPDIYFHVECVQGATASGLENPNSKTAAYAVFMKALNEYNGTIVITLLGEVDTGFVIWYWAQKHSSSLAQSLKRAANTYCRFIDKIAKKRTVICLSAPLPTISDDNDWGDVANLRSEINASQLERTQMTLAFNALVKEHCRENKYSYIDLDIDALGTDGLVKKRLMHENPLNHHYNNEAYSVLMTDRLRPIMSNLIS